MVQLAVKTMAAFEQVVKQDGGNLWKSWMQKVLPQMGDIYRQEDSPFRTHMGASTIGRKCAREIWYGFHWATVKQHEGRMIRLWNHGHMEEARLVALLLSIGCTVYQQDAQGKQFKISVLGGHFGGSGDGVFVGCPDLAPGTPALSEFKTHNDKSFQKIKNIGVREGKTEHYVQMQQYMRHMQLAVGVYFAVNKNDEEIYAEIVLLDVANADMYTQRAINIIHAGNKPPDKISNTPGAFDCRFCDHRPVCHLGAPPQVNCRTCVFSDPVDDGTWRCTNAASGELELSKERQHAGCSHWTKNTAAFR